MDHSYSTEREKVQKTDHSYFTVAKKTPKVVLRKAQMMKEHPELNRTSIGQDHSYVRSDHLLQPEFINVDAVNDEDDCPPQNDAQTHQNQGENNQLVESSLQSNQLLSIPLGTCTDSICVSRETSELPGCDLDNIDTQISGIKLDHAYDLKLNICANRRSTDSLVRSERMASAVTCYDPWLRLRLHDHTYLGRSAMKIMDKA